MVGSGCASGEVKERGNVCLERDGERGGRGKEMEQVRSMNNAQTDKDRKKEKEKRRVR